MAKVQKDQECSCLIKLRSWIFLEIGPFENTAEGHLLTKVAVSYIKHIVHDQPTISNPRGDYGYGRDHVVDMLNAS